MKHRTAGGVLAARLRACWHVLRGRGVVYGFRNIGGEWSSAGGRTLFIGCTFKAGFKADGVPAAEMTSRHDDLDVRPGAPSSP